MNSFRRVGLFVILLAGGTFIASSTEAQSLASSGGETHVASVADKYCKEFGHCPNEDSRGYGNWANHFFALRGWLTERLHEDNKRSFQSFDSKERERQRFNGHVEGFRDMSIFKIEPTVQDERWYYDACPTERHNRIIGEPRKD